MLDFVNPSSQLIDYPATPAAFCAIMQRAMELVGEKIPRAHLQEVAKIFTVLCWDFRDLQRHVYFQVSPAGEVCCPEAASAQTTVTIDSRVFHDAAFGKTSLATAFFLGKLKVQGISVLKLGKFTPLMKPFLESYCEACERHHEQQCCQQS
jgi:hypothetical protein